MFMRSAWCVVVCWLIGNSVAVAQTDVASAKEATQKRIAAAEKIVEAATYYRIVDGQQEEVKLIDRPIIRPQDAVRGELGGGIWAIGDEGRPIALTVVYTFADSPTWYTSITSLASTADIGARRAEGTQWRPLKPGVVMKPLPDAPRPAERAILRLRQMKEQARRFTGHEFWNPNNQRYELRLLPQPLHRYSDEDEGIVDGCIFALAHGTNPEVYLLIEAHEQDGGQQWYYGLARFGYAEMHVNIDEEEVWEQPRIAGTSPTDPYWLFHLPKSQFPVSR